MTRVSLALRVLVRWLAFLLAGIAATSCGGSGGGNDGPPMVINPTPVIQTRTADLLDFVGGTLPYAQAFSEGYVVPTPLELSQFDALLDSLIDEDFDAVQASAADLGLRLIRFFDAGANNNELYCLEEVSLEGRGFFCLDPDSTNTHHISVPHPLFDRNTNTESVTVMRATGARFLSISTTHRCSNVAVSACSGTTSVCGASGAYKVSDVAHTVDAFFFRFGVAVHDQSSTARTVQLHGCGSTSCPSNNDVADIVARLSAGTTSDLPATEPVNVLNAELNAELAPLQLGTSLSCNEPGANKQLCGATNTLGRYINGQNDPCQNAATNFTDSRWLHIEQNANLRQDDGAGDAVTPNILVNALNDTLGQP